MRLRIDGYLLVIEELTDRELNALAKNRQMRISIASEELAIFEAEQNRRSYDRSSLGTPTLF